LNSTVILKIIVQIGHEKKKKQENKTITLSLLKHSRHRLVSHQLHIDTGHSRINQRREQELCG